MNLPTPAPEGEQRALVPAEVVRQNIQTVASQHPDLVSYDPTTDQGEALSLRILLDPGIPPAHRDKWRGTVCHWGISPYECKGKEEGETDIVPSLALVSEEGELVRLTGWTAIKSWAKLVEAAGKDRCLIGIKVRIVRQPSQTAGRSYWLVLPDA